MRFSSNDGFEALKKECSDVIARYGGDPEVAHEWEDELKDAAIAWLARASSTAQDREQVAAIIKRMVTDVERRKWFA